jgi:chromosomal replication initiation ATPase DnaA
VVIRDQYTEETVHDVTGLPCPYFGLRPFTYEFSSRYAGRSRQLDHALERLTTPGAEQPLVFVTGMSGSGKTSFVQAG